ncbi:MAG: aspartate kinase [Cyclobacteriaceae bacterium]|nr:aspartate kinase [Cyclobacteriaceae bacterium]
MQVLKFGGTSVGSPERMKKVARLICADEKMKIVVLSAVSGTTNALVEITQFLNDEESIDGKLESLHSKYLNFIEELYTNEKSKQKALAIVEVCFDEIKKCSKEKYSSVSEKIILAQGEIISTNLFQIYLEEIEVDAVLLSALSFMYIDEDEEPDVAKIQERLKVEIEKSDKTKLYITQGFICENANGEIDNLKRGGSDYTASLIGAAINADEVQIWTDIDGMHNNDPRYVRNTFPIEELSFDEAAELAYFGAKILHPLSILPAKKYNIPVRLKSTMDEAAQGTLITQRLTDKGIQAIAAKDGITAVKIKSARMLLAHGFLRKIFEVFEVNKTSIDMITTSEVAVSLTIDDEEYLPEIISELEKLGVVEIDRNQTIICIVGNMVAEKTGVIKNIFDALSGIPIRMVSYGGSRHNISVLINTEYKIQALRDLNEGLFQIDKHESIA